MNIEEIIKKFDEEFEFDDNTDAIKYFIRTEFTAMVDEIIEIVDSNLFIASSLTEQDLKRGKLSLLYPEVMELYETDQLLRLNIFENLKELLSKLKE